jgi:hypothetical protein
MRYTMLCCVALLVLGCRQQAVPDGAGGRAEGGGTSQTEAGKAMPAEGKLAGSSAATSSDGANVVVELNAITLKAPAGWQRKPAGSSFVTAEFVLPGEGDSADGRLTVSTAGGSVEANIDRWKGQFQPEPESASEEVVEVAGLKVSMVDLSGTFNDRRGPFAPGELRPGYRMIAAVIPVNGQLHFIKATGPQDTIASHAEEINAFIRSVQPK